MAEDPFEDIFAHVNFYRLLFIAITNVLSWLNFVMSRSFLSNDFAGESWLRHLFRVPSRVSLVQMRTFLATKRMSVDDMHTPTSSIIMSLSLLE